MINLVLAVGIPVVVKLPPGAVTVLLQAGHVSHRCIQPYVKILAWRIGYFKAEIRCITGDVPVPEIFLEPFLELVRDSRLQRVVIDPVMQYFFKVIQLEE